MYELGPFRALSFFVTKRSTQIYLSILTDLTGSFFLKFNVSSKFVSGAKQHFIQLTGVAFVLLFGWKLLTIKQKAKYKV